MVQKPGQPELCAQGAKLNARGFWRVLTSKSGNEIVIGGGFAAYATWRGLTAMGRRRREKRFERPSRYRKNTGVM